MSINRIYLPAKLSKNIDGTIHLKVDRELLQAYYLELMMGDPEIDVEICLTRIDAKKTIPQLAYFFGVVLPIIKEQLEELEGTTMTKDDVMTILKSLFLYEEILFEGEFKKVPMSLSKAKKSEVNKFIQDVMDFARDMLGVEIPEPTKEIEYGRQPN
jgi:hypothetical protein